MIGSVGDSLVRMREAPAAFADETLCSSGDCARHNQYPTKNAAVAVSSTPDELSAPPRAEPEVNAIVVQTKELLPERSGPSSRPMHRPAKQPKKVEELPAKSGGRAVSRSGKPRDVAVARMPMAVAPAILA